MEEIALNSVYEALQQENKLKTESKKKVESDEDSNSDEPKISSDVQQEATATPGDVDNEQIHQSDWVFVDQEEVPEYMKCNIICCNVFVAPQLLTCCGKNVCKRCIDSHVQRAAHSETERMCKPSCPHCRKEDFRLIPNTALELSINQLRVECPYQKNGCSWSGSLKHGNLHLKECKFVLIDCPNQCGCPKFERGRLPSHVTMCPLQYINCPFQAVGCDTGALFLRMEWSRGHPVSNLHQHLLLIAQMNAQVSSQCESHSILRNAIHIKGVKEYTDMIRSQNGILESLKLAMKSLGESLCDTRQKIDSLKHILATDKICIAKLERTNEEAENTNACFMATIEAVKALPVPKAIDLETACPINLPITFSINNFRKRITMNDIWTSPPFYTHAGGYKMLIFVYPNGCGDARGKFVSVGLHLMSGEYDDHLKWPFSGAIITLTAVNHRRMNNRSKHFEFVGENRIFDDNLRCGHTISQYISHRFLSNYLDYGNCFELKLYRIQFLPL